MRSRQRDAGFRSKPCDLAALKAAISDKQAKAAQPRCEVNGAEQEAKLVEAQMSNSVLDGKHSSRRIKSADASSRAAHVAGKEVQD